MICNNRDNFFYELNAAPFTWNAPFSMAPSNPSTQNCGQAAK